MKKDIDKVETTIIANTKAVKAPKKPSLDNRSERRKTEEFKKRYFEYYDDIKISDRQDW